jgi:hypothetical protein
MEVSSNSCRNGSRSGIRLRFINARSRFSRGRLFKNTALNMWFTAAQPRAMAHRASAVRLWAKMLKIELLIGGPSKWASFLMIVYFNGETSTSPSSAPHLRHSVNDVRGGSSLHALR